MWANAILNYWRLCSWLESTKNGRFSVRSCESTSKMVWNYRSIATSAAQSWKKKYTIWKQHQTSHELTKVNSNLINYSIFSLFFIALDIASCMIIILLVCVCVKENQQLKKMKWLNITFRCISVSIFLFHSVSPFAYKYKLILVVCSAHFLRSKIP